MSNLITNNAEYVSINNTRENNNERENDGDEQGEE